MGTGLFDQGFSLLEPGYGQADCRIGMISHVYAVRDGKSMFRAGTAFSRPERRMAEKQGCNSK